MNSLLTRLFSQKNVCFTIYLLQKKRIHTPKYESSSFKVVLRSRHKDPTGSVHLLQNVCSSHSFWHSCSMCCFSQFLSQPGSTHCNGRRLRNRFLLNFSFWHLPILCSRLLQHLVCRKVIRNIHDLFRIEQILFRDVIKCFIKKTFGMEFGHREI